MSVRLDFSKFKKTKVDEKKGVTTLESPDGHSVTIAHKALHPKMRKSLDSLPMHSDQRPMFAHGGEVGHPCKNRACKSFGVAHPNCRCYGLAKGGEVGYMCSKDSMHKEDCEYFMPKYAEGTLDVQPMDRYTRDSLSLPKTPEAAALMEERKAFVDKAIEDAQQSKMNQAALAGMAVDLPGVTPPPSAPQAIMPSEEPTVPAPSELMASTPMPSLPASTPMPSSPSGLSGKMGESSASLMDAYNKQVAGHLAEADVAAKVAKEQATQLAANAKAQQELMASNDAKTKELDAERKAFVEDLKNGHVDPGRFMGNLSTDQKMSVSLGLALGGIGSTLAGGPNQVMDFVNKLIDRDIDAQKADLGKRETLLSANLKQYGNLREATDMTRVMLLDHAKTTTEQIAAKNGGAMAKARAQVVIGQLEQQIAPSIMNMAFRQAAMSVMSGSEQDDSAIDAKIRAISAVDPEMGKQLTEKYVPGMGVGSISVPHEVRDQLFKKTNLVQATENLKNWVKKNGVSLDPKVRAYGQTLAAELQQIYRQGVGASTSEGEQHIIEKIISSNPAGVLEMMTVDPKLDALLHSMRSSLNLLKSQYRLKQDSPESKLTPKHREFVEWARKNPSDPRAKKALEKLGIE